MTDKRTRSLKLEARSWSIITLLIPEAESKMSHRWFHFFRNKIDKGVHWHAGERVVKVEVDDCSDTVDQREHIGNTIILIEVRKSVWGMPRLSEAKKDVISCEKLRGLANTNWSADVRMGQPGILKVYHPPQGEKQTRRTETSKYPEEEKTI